MMPSLQLLLVILAFFFKQSAGTSNVESDLRDALLSTYDKHLVPKGDDNGPVVINHTISIYRVLALDNDVLTMSVWEFMKWKDPRLQWSLDKYNISSVNFRSDWLWLPDIMLLDSVEEYSGLITNDVLVVLSNDGTVSYIPPRIRKSACDFSESGLFANNTVTCSLEYMSWTRSLESFDLRISKQPTMYHNDNQYWRVEDKSAIRNVKEYSCCPEKYVDITYKIQLKRIK